MVLSITSSPISSSSSMDERIFHFGFVVCSKIHGGVITVCFCSRDIEQDLDEALGLLHNVISTLHYTALQWNVSAGMFPRLPAQRMNVCTL